MSMGNKLLLCFGAIVLLVAGLAFGALWAVDGLSTQLADATGKTSLKTELAGAIATDIAGMRGAQRGMILFTMLRNPSVKLARETFPTSVAGIRTHLTAMRPYW